MKTESLSAATPPERRTQDVPVIVLVSVVFGLCSLCYVPVPGVNEPHYLCKARAFWDGQWCARDYFLHSADAHVVFFAVVGAAAQIFPLAVVAVVGRLVSLTLLGLAWVALGRRLALSSWAIVLSACCFCGIALTGNFSGEWVVGGLEGKVPAYGFSLLSIAFWLDALQTGHRGRYLLSGVCSGLSVALHPVVGLWFCIGVALSEAVIFACRRLRLDGVAARTLKVWVFDGVTFAGAAFLLSLPGLMPAVLLLTSQDVSPAEVDRANYIQVFWRLAHHLDPSTFPPRGWIHAGVLLCVCTACWLGLRLRRGAANLSPAWQPWLLLLTVSTAIAAVGVGIGWHSEAAQAAFHWQWRAALLKFYPFRMFDALLSMTAALLVARVAELARQSAAAVGGGSATGTSETVTAQTAHGPIPVFGKATFVCLCLVVVTSLWQRPAAPGSYQSSQFVDWKSACEWIRQQTPPESLVFTPRESFGFKWFAERAEYVCIKDCPQDTTGILEWNRRLWAIHDWASNAFQDGRFDNSDLAQLQQQTGCNYVLTRRLGPFEATPIYQNDTWRVYAIAADTEPNSADPRQGAGLR